MATYLKNIRIINGKNDSVIENGHVVIKGEYIDKVSRNPIKFQEGKVINCTGKTLLPGLIDTHVHLSGDASPSVLDKFKDTD